MNYKKDMNPVTTKSDDTVLHSLCLKIVNIYVNLARGDKDKIFPAAIIRDGRSYNEQVIFLENFHFIYYYSARNPTQVVNCDQKVEAIMLSISSFLFCYLFGLGLAIRCCS